MADRIKTEEGLHIKPDPANAATPSVLEEDDYEDTGELTIPGSAEEAGAWLAKLPKWLWEAWADIAGDEEIELGKVRVYHPKPGESDEKGQKIRIVLNDIPGHKEVPKRYDINMNKTTYNNTVVFSEKDQPGFKASSWGRDRRMQKQKEVKQEGNRVSKKPYRSSIPKQTALAGFLKHEVTVTAVENDEYRQLMDARYRKMFQPKHTTTYRTGVDHDMHPGMFANERGATFAAAGQQKKGKKVQQEKAVRVSQQELLDLLQSCFREFRYWSLRALKQRLKQPEAYIKTVIEKIATLVRSGPFTGNYKLNDEYEASVKRENTDVKEEAAAEEGETDDDIKDDDVDDGEDDFEDVRMDEG